MRWLVERPQRGRVQTGPVTWDTLSATTPLDRLNELDGYPTIWFSTADVAALAGVTAAQVRRAHRAHTMPRSVRTEGTCGLYEPSTVDIAMWGGA